jgi:Domain of unknown function (DUF4365)
LISREHTQEALSLAYVHALAGRAGLNIAARATFDYGIDGYFYRVKMRGRERVETGAPVRFQMKASVDWQHRDGHVVYDLDARAHRTIAERDPEGVMTILILLCLPRDENQWLTGSETEMYLRHCCYWYRTEDPPTENPSKQRIRIPRANVLTPDSLQGIMTLAREEALAGR